jgi:hypothetical protein
MAETTIHAIVGKGCDLPKQVVWADLEDFITSSSEVAVGWYGGKPSESNKYVYDYLIGNNIHTTLVYQEDAGMPPPVFSKHDNITVAPVADIVVGLAQLTTPGAKALINGLTDAQVVEYFDRTAGVELFDIEGLVPISLTSSEDEAPPAPTPSDVDLPDVSGFTGEELMGLSFKVLKRIAESVATSSNNVPDTKTAAVAMILAAAQTPEEPEHTEEDMAIQKAETDEAIEAFGGTVNRDADLILKKSHEELVADLTAKEENIAHLGDFGKALAQARSSLAALTISTRQMAIIKTKLDEAQLWFEHGEHI